VKNYQNDLRFKWAILSAMFPAATVSDRLTDYLPYENAIDCSSITFPVTCHGHSRLLGLLGPGTLRKNLRISTDILWRIFHVFDVTGSMYVCVSKSTE